MVQLALHFEDNLDVVLVEVGAAIEHLVAEVHLSPKADAGLVGELHDPRLDIALGAHIVLTSSVEDLAELDGAVSTPTGQVGETGGGRASTQQSTGGKVVEGARRPQRMTDGAQLVSRKLRTGDGDPLQSGDPPCGNLDEVVHASQAMSTSGMPRDLAETRRREPEPGYAPQRGGGPM